MARSMVGRGIVACILAGVAAGCGGDSGTSPDDPKAGKPASVAVQAGNGQSAEVGKPVATAPAVVVKDANGKPVAGTQVNFVVEQGGGSVGSAHTSTNTGGVASATQWVMGDQPGPQRLVATVPGLPAVAFTATAMPDASALATQSIGPAGGSMAVNSAGSPLNGVRLSFDAGALPSAATITLTEVPASQLSIPAGMTARTPGLGISTSVGRAAAGVAVRFPTPAATGELLMVGFANATTGAVTLLPTVRQERDAITALVPSFDAPPLTSSVVSRSLAGGSLAADNTPGSVVLLLSINEELLNRDFDSGFRPGVDDWDFPRMAIADLSFAKSASDASQPFAVADDGMISTSLWYYANRRANGAPPLNGSTQLLEGQPLSSRAGIRWATLAGRDVPAINQVGSLLVKEWNEWATDDRGRFLWLQFQGIKALMLTTFERPVPVVLLDTDSPNEFNAESRPMAIAYRTTGNTLYLAWPGSPGQSIQATFSEQGMAPFTISNSNGTAMTVRAIGGVHYVNVVNDGKLAAQWPRVANGTIGDAEGWPTPELHWEKDQLDTARTYLLDELQMWWECDRCPDRVARPSQLPETAGHVQRFRSTNLPGSGTLSASFSSVSLSAEDTFEGESRVERKGFVVEYPIERDDFVGAVGVGWLDWLEVAFRKLELEPSLASIETTKDTTVTLSVTPSETPPAGTSYRWLLRTDDMQDSVETTTPTHTREIEAGTEGWLVFSALEGKEKRPIARDSIKVGGDGPLAAWRILTLSDPNDMFDDTEASGNEAELLRRLIQVPTSGLITIEEIEGEKVLRLRVKRSGSWSANDCCPIAAFSTGTERVMPLGFSPPRTHPVGPFFSGWGTSFWEQSSESLDAGTLTGQYAMGMHVYRVKDAGSQTGPAGGVRISANRNGITMTGEIAVYIWFEDDEGQLGRGADIYRMPFTAVRMR